MKYRTVIEIVCDASDKEEAFHTAGDYLKGDIDFGIDMKCKTAPLSVHRVVKYSASLAIVLLAFSTIVLNVTNLGGNVNVGRTASTGLSTYTVMPELKTQKKSEFKKEWKERKDAAVWEYIKK